MKCRRLWPKPRSTCHLNTAPPPQLCPCQARVAVGPQSTASSQPLASSSRARVCISGGQPNPVHLNGAHPCLLDSRGAGYSGDRNFEACLTRYSTTRVNDHINKKFSRHPGVLVAKVRYFGVKSAKVPQGQMGTKLAKVSHLAANLIRQQQQQQKKVPP